MHSTHPCHASAAKKEVRVLCALHSYCRVSGVKDFDLCVRNQRPLGCEIFRRGYRERLRQAVGDFSQMSQLLR